MVREKQHQTIVNAKVYFLQHQIMAARPSDFKPPLLSRVSFRHPHPNTGAVWYHNMRRQDGFHCLYANRYVVAPTEAAIVGQKHSHHANTLLYH